MRLSLHFTLAELTVTNTGLDNTPPQAIADRLILMADRLEGVRRALGAPLFISSGYRSPSVNTAVGGASNSHHVQGFAFDFTAPGYGSCYRICAALIAAEIPFDQLIHERRKWVHISFAPTFRRDVLTLPVGAKKYQQGLLK